MESFDNACGQRLTEAYKICIDDRNADQTRLDTAHQQEISNLKNSKEASKIEWNARLEALVKEEEQHALVREKCRAFAGSSAEAGAAFASSSKKN